MTIIRLSQIQTSYQLHNGRNHVVILDNGITVQVIETFFDKDEDKIDNYVWLYRHYLPGASPDWKIVKEVPDTDQGFAYDEFPKVGDLFSTPSKLG